jgi:cytidylate kinase
VRAKRRYIQLVESGDTGTTEQEILDSIQKRDEQDSTRNIAPLKKADDAIEVDTSDLTLEQVIEKVVSVISDWKKKHGTK